MVPARPFAIGKPGWVRSSAWICDFSSSDRTMACSGGLRYRPTTSSSDLGKARIVRQFEGRHQMRLQASPSRSREHSPARCLPPWPSFAGSNVQASGGVSVLVFAMTREITPRRVAACPAGASCRGTSRPRQPQHNAFASAERSASHAQPPLNHGGSHPVASQQHDPVRDGHASVAYCRWRSTPPTCPDPRAPVGSSLSCPCPHIRINPPAGLLLRPEH